MYLHFIISVGLKRKLMYTYAVIQYFGILLLYMLFVEKFNVCIGHTYVICACKKTPKKQTCMYVSGADPMVYARRD